ncbi:MAG: M56 family metallopeptidase [Bacteroidota bacterium]
MINYIVQVLLFQTVFLAVYDIILKKETFFQWNRAYLIITSALAYVLPLLKFQTVQENIPQEYVVMLPEVMLSPSAYIEKQIDWSVILFEGLRWVFLIGIVIASLVFIYKLLQIVRLISKNSSEKTKDYSLVFLQENNTAFSFFNYIFLGKTVKKKDEIIKHELVHVKQKHSVDLLLFEIQKIVFWFNPFSYLYQSRISEIHEFIADSGSVSKKERSTFFNSLLAGAFQVDKIAFVNSFHKQSLIKKRIIMFSKNESKRILKLKYLLMLPVLAGMLIYSSCENTEADKKLSKVNEKRHTKLVFGGYTKDDGTVVKEKIIEGKKEGYFDFYYGRQPEGKEIHISDLTEEERTDYMDITDRFKKDENGNYNTFKIFEMENGSKAIQHIVDFKGMKESWSKKDYSNADEVPFGVIDKGPVYPGCENAEDPKKCFEESMMNHISANFDKSVSKGLGLEPGKKRVYVQFKIDKTGEIVDVKARGPHEELEKEATRVINSLPQMQPGEENGKKVGVKYTLPISLVVE